MSDTNVQGEYREGICARVGCTKPVDTTSRWFCLEHQNEPEDVQDGELRRNVYRLLNNIDQRCNNPNHPWYKNYGGRGIKVCDRWSGRGRIDNFISDMGFRPEGLTLDRIDNDGDYDPQNCRWATRSVQSHNQRKKHDADGLKGVWKNRGKWSAYIGVNGKQIHLGTWTDIEQAIKHRKDAEEKYYGQVA